MTTESESIYERCRGRMRLNILRKPGKYGLQYSAIIYRPYNKAESEHGNSIWKETHWLDK
jgi:hypothetical protein